MDHRPRAVPRRIGALEPGAWSAGSPIAFHAVQGVGGGVMLPLMSTLVVQAAGGKNLGTIMSVVGLPAVLGPILGPVVGGLILAHLH